MIYHYFKVAFRSYLNNKVQSLITLFSLAVAFAFVSLSAYWTHYEQTYDSFLSGYENIHLIGQKRAEGMDFSSIYGLHSHLMEKYPEVDKACGVKSGWNADRMVEINNRILHAGCEEITPEAIDVFEIQWVEGNRNMDSWKKNEVAVSEQIARDVCGKDSPIGKKLELKNKDGDETVDEYQIVAVFKTWPQHSNFNFHVLQKYEPDFSPYKQPIYRTYVRFRPDADPHLFLRKLASNPIVEENGIEITYSVMIPLSHVRKVLSEGKRSIRLNDVKLFTGASILLSVCALLNYLTLFISRLRARGRDVALRTICGSSSWQTGMLLMVEYLLLLLVALCLSLLFIELFYNGFLSLSQLKIGRATIYSGCGYLLLFILALAAFLSLVPILYFKNKTLKVQIDSTPIQLGRNRFRIAGVCLQLFISLLFIFCSTIMIKQIHYLIHADINIERKNIAWLSAPFGLDVMMSQLKQIPSVMEMVGVQAPIFPPSSLHTHDIQGFDGREDLVINATEVYVDRDVAGFYGLKMKKGPESFDLKQGEVLINETFAKQLGDPNPIGKIFPQYKEKRHNYLNPVIRGIVCDFQYQNPTKPTPALYFSPTFEFTSKYSNTVAFKYTGDFNETQAAIMKAFNELAPDPDDPNALEAYKRFSIHIEDGETVYNSYLTSEFNLLKLLNILTVISLLIALFGVYALIYQECERQRKNIAIRKVYGAQVKDILMMFFKEYMLQVAIAALVAFPIGYVLMKGWLEGYSRQTGVGIGVFLGIFVGMSVLVSLCIGWHVWKAANENPATAVKKE